MNQNNTSALDSIPVVTRNIIIINALAFIATTLLKDLNLDNYLSLHYVTSSLFMPHQIITYMFMHGSIGHIFFNMFAVFMFGRILETIWGPKKFLLYYVLTGIGAAALQILITYIRIKGLEATVSSDIVAQINAGATSVMANVSDHAAIEQLFGLINGPMLGASGAVFGILVAFGMIFPNTQLMLLFPPIPIKAKWFVIGYGVLELVLGVIDSPSDNIAHFAHLGGLITGLLFLLYWRKKGFTTNGRIY